MKYQPLVERETFLPSTSAILKTGYRKVLWAIVATILLLCGLFLFFQLSSTSWNSDIKNQPASVETTPTVCPTVAGDPRCEAIPDPGNVLFVIKTGATEVYEKLPTQLITTLGCAKQYLIFSDLEEQIGHYHARDALDTFNSSIVQSHPDFQLYRMQQEYKRNGQDIGELKRDGQAAWTLDKYKFLHMVEKTWNASPNMDWYVFIESDTYIVWTNLILWLHQLPASKELYMGSKALYLTQGFAHGGSGYVISGKLLERFAGAQPGIASRYDDAIALECCGDVALGRAIKQELGIDVQNRWPMINGENPSTIPFGPSHWCQPVVTMHHILPRQRSVIWDFEQARENVSKPLLFQELSEITFPSTNLRVLEEDWDNLSNAQVEFPDGQVPTFETCREACFGLPDCFQYRYSDDQCHVLTDAFKLGSKKSPGSGGKQYISGWNVRKIQEWRETHPCGDPEWVEAY